uniref:Uncharacterized protein n=1 Tax=Arundo donax TaxID=35708 RepID=A0A0A9AAM6_ARUDO
MGVVDNYCSPSKLSHRPSVYLV